MAATPVTSAASSAGIAGGTGMAAAAPTPAPTVAVALAAPATSLSASSSGPSPGNWARSVWRSRTGTRGAISLMRSARYASPARARAPPLRAPSLARSRKAAALRRATGAGTSSGAGRSPWCPACSSEAPPVPVGPRSWSRASCCGPLCGPWSAPLAKKRRFREGFEPVTADPPSVAVAADRLAVLLPGQLTAVVHQEAAHAGELVLLLGQHPDGQLLVREVRSGQFQALGGLELVDVHGGRRLVVAPGLQFFQTVRVDVVVGLAWSVVVGCHARSPPLGVCGVSSARNA